METNTTTEVQEQVEAERNRAAEVARLCGGKHPEIQVFSTET